MAWCWSATALASSPEAAEEPSPSAGRYAIEPPPAPERTDYRLTLGAAYLFAPVLAAGAGVATFELTRSDGLAVAGGAMMFALPLVIHAAHGNLGRGAASALGMLGVTALGVLLGGATGYYIGVAGCAEGDGDCSLSGLPVLVGGAALGGLVGYAGYAIYDVAFNAVAPRKRMTQREEALQLWVQPLPSEGAARAETSLGLALAGAQLKAAFAW